MELLGLILHMVIQQKIMAFFWKLTFGKLTALIASKMSVGTRALERMIISLNSE